MKARHSHCDPALIADRGQRFVSGAPQTAACRMDKQMIEVAELAERDLFPLERVTLAGHADKAVAVKRERREVRVGHVARADIEIDFTARHQIGDPTLLSRCN